MTAFSAEAATLPIPRVDEGGLLPTIDMEYARRVRAAGHIRIGIGPWLVRGDGKIFMQEHEESAKTRDGALGTMTETVRWHSANPAARIEQPAETMAFGFSQEDNVQDANSLGLRIAAKHGWLLHACPVSYCTSSPTILGIWPVLTIPESGAAQLVSGFKPSPEVRAVDFMSEADIRQRPQVDFRFGMKDWLLKAIAEGYIGPGDGQQVVLPLPKTGSQTAFYIDMDLQQVI